MNIVIVPFIGNNNEKNLDYKQSFSEIIKQYSFLKTNEDGRNDVSEVIEVDDFDSIGEYVKDHSVFVGTDNRFTANAFKHFLAKNSNDAKNNIPINFNNNGNAGLLSFDSDCSCLELVKTGILSPNNIIFAATRAWSREDADYIKQQKINYFSMKKIFEFGIDEATDTIMELAREFSALYISIDISCVDPAFAACTIKHDSGGLTSRELIYMIQRLKLLKNLKVVDIVGFSQEIDANTARLAAKIIKELS